jgi:hypothetical protein
MVSATSQPYLVSVSMRVQYLLHYAVNLDWSLTPLPRVDGVVLLVHAYPHRDRNHAGLRVLFFAEVAGCVLTIVTSWYSILKELTD